MNEQKNLFLAIGISIAIIVFFQIFFPSQPIQNTNIESEDTLKPATSIDDNSSITINDIQPKEEVLKNNKRVNINTLFLKGSINLKGAILDDLSLNNYKTSLDENAKNIDLFLPDGTSNPYYVEVGWKEISDTNVDLPDLNTIWKSNSSELDSENQVILTWINNQNITFKITYELDDKYMFSIKQEVINKSAKNLELFPYRLIKRINTPKTINFFILHEGLISLLNDELIEKDYDDLLDDCSSSINTKKSYCDNKSSGGWLGFTDKYWMSVLIPNKNGSKMDQ